MGLWWKSLKFQALRDAPIIHTCNSGPRTACSCTRIIIIMALTNGHRSICCHPTETYGSIVVGKSCNYITCYYSYLSSLHIHKPNWHRCWLHCRNAIQICKLTRQKENKVQYSTKTYIISTLNIECVLTCQKYWHIFYLAILCLNAKLKLMFCQYCTFSLPDYVKNYAQFS